MFRPGTSNKSQGQGNNPYPDSLIANAAALPFPIEARLAETGEPVTLLQTCDWQGHSPSNVAVDRNGKQVIAAFQEVTVTDVRVVPNERLSDIRARVGTGAGSLLTR